MRTFLAFAVASLIAAIPAQVAAQYAPPAQPFQRLDGCIYKPQRWDDGDSFHVVLPDGRDSRTYLAHLAELEAQARAAKRGAWLRSAGGTQSQFARSEKQPSYGKDLAVPTEFFISFDSMPLENPDQLHLRAADGYIDLGMFEAANAELEEIDPFCRHAPEVLLARANIYHGLKKWELMGVVAKKLVKWNPDEPGYFVDLAYATRRAESIHMAHAILTQAAELHPKDKMIQFNLACYESQLGNIDRAKAHLTSATKIDAKFSAIALDDPDLEPLWASLAAD